MAAAEPIQVGATPIPLYPARPNDMRAGNLIYRGGLHLTSDDPRFGGLSDLIVSSDGSRVLAVTDEAHWFRAALRYAPDGDLADLVEGELEPMLDLDGRELAGKDGDAEGLAAVTDGILDGPVLVSFEREHRIWRYDLSSGQFDRPPDVVPAGPWIENLESNEGLEALVLLGPQLLLVLSENGPGADGNILGARLSYGPDMAESAYEPVMIARRPPFAVTGAARAPDGSVLVLGRRFSVLGGLGAEIRYISAKTAANATTIDGEIVADLNFQEANIDNMEGIAARAGANGETYLYLISDDNFQRSLQRTLLLMFELQS
jgi:hypothetical protein